MEKIKTENKVHQDAILAALNAVAVLNANNDPNMAIIAEQVKIIATHLSAMFAVQNARESKMRSFEGKEGGHERGGPGGDSEDAQKERARKIAESKDNES